MTQETWNTFLDVMNKSKNVTVIDLTKKENDEKENLVNKFDALFYDLNSKDMDIANIYLRDVLRLVPNNNLRGLIKEMENEKI